MMTTRLYLPKWAWQTIRMFNREFLDGAEGHDLRVRKALLTLALTPNSPTVTTVQSKLGVTTSVWYRTASGWVDIARAEEGDGSFTGHIHVSGIPGSGGRDIVAVYKLRRACGPDHQRRRLVGARHASHCPPRSAVSPPEATPLPRQ